MASTEQFDVIPWDDGHNPGSAKVGATTNTKMAINREKAASGFLNVIDGLLSDSWCEDIYQYALQKGRPWGAYVTTSDVLNPDISTEDLYTQDPEKAISLQAVRAFFQHKGCYFLAEDKTRIHGCAVWCLSSGETNSVEYHIDYAELYRYETNIIHPPLYAGTCHVSPLVGDEMLGGDFSANLNGLDHYKRFGYKGQLAPLTELEKDMESTGDWVKVRYRRNRGIIHDGDLPHFSSRVRSMPLGKRRVILGFNFFSDAVGECCIRAPEHSDAFNRTVKLYQMMSKIGTHEGGDVENSKAPEVEATDSANTSPRPARKGGFSAKDIAKNPAMARMFVMAAKKMKAVQEREAAEKLATKTDVSSADVCS
mmetsp:Transcript_15372/g.23150  ORF Transcript_15372/g.23150 Transcript_15372/m.23150 type:complete len:367 (-) Transcript_15372:168-1268(-)